MKLRMHAVMLSFCLSVTPLSPRVSPVPNEENCRMAIAAGLEQLHRIPPDISERDNEDRKKLLAEMLSLVETNRRQRVSECQTWTQMMGRAFNQ